MEMEGAHLFSPPTPRLHHQYPWCALILWGREDGFGRAAPHRPLSTCYAAFVIGILCFISMTKLAPHPATPNHTLPYELLSAILWSPRAESLHSPHHPPSRPPSNWPYEWPGRMLQSLCLLDNDLKLKSLFRLLKPGRIWNGNASSSGHYHHRQLTESFLFI